jgi:hypothetical protein
MARFEGTAAQTRIVVYWTLFAPGRAPLVCDLCRTATGLELQCGSGSNLRRTSLRDAADALATAQAWKNAYITEDGYSEYAPDVDHGRADETATALQKRAKRQRGADLRRKAGAA